MPYIAKGDKILQIDTKEHADEFIEKYGFHYLPNSTVRRVKKKMRKSNDKGVQRVSN